MLITVYLACMAYRATVTQERILQEYAKSLEDPPTEDTIRGMDTVEPEGRRDCECGTPRRVVRQSAPSDDDACETADSEGARGAPHTQRKKHTTDEL